MKTLSDLGVDYIDLYLSHWPLPLKYIPIEEQYPPTWFTKEGKLEADFVPMHETWAAMEELVNEGLVKHIGISNMQTAGVRDVLAMAKIKPAVLQNELHPYLPQHRVVKYCHEHKMAVTGYSSLGAGSYVDINLAVKEESCLNEPIVKQIAEAHGKTPAQVVYKWSLQHGICIIPKSVQESRIKENFDVYNFTLTKEQLDQLATLNTGKRFNDIGDWSEAKGDFMPLFQ